MSGTADIVRALGGPRLVPAKSPGQLRALVRAGLPYASLAAVAAGFELRGARCGLDPAHPASARSPGARRSGGSRPRSRTGWSASPASPPWPRRCWEAGTKAGRWLAAQNRGLGGRTPLSELDTDLGAEEVESVLLRLAHGVVG